MSVSFSVSALPSLVARDDLDLGDALGEAKRGLERVGEATLDSGPAHQTVDDDLDRVLLVARQRELVGEVVHLAVDPGTRVALRRRAP